MIDKDEQIEILLGLTKEMASLGLSRSAEMHELRMINCDMHSALSGALDFLEHCKDELSHRGETELHRGIIRAAIAKAEGHSTDLHTKLETNHVDTEI